MNFFKTVFADESESDREPETETESDLPETTTTKNDEPDPNPSGSWTFGALIKTLSEKSESVIETYRRDLQEFGSGLKKEIEVAQGSLGTVTHVIDEFGNTVIKGTAQIISQGKEAILSVDHESDSSDNPQPNQSSKRYSRFEAQVRAIQGDVTTYCDEVEDLEDYKKWKLGFVISREEIESLIEENGVIESIYKKVVPGSVDDETFWSRYFYKVYKLKQAEEVRASLVKRAISTDEDEVLSWDVDDDDEEEEEGAEGEKDGNENVGGGDLGKIVKDVLVESSESSEVVDHNVGSENVEKGESVVESCESLNDEKEKLETNVEASNDEKVGSEGKVGSEESSKYSDFSVVSSQPAMPEEEDLGWDEIEDLSTIDEKIDKKVTHGGGSPDRGDLRKRLSVAEEEEDLSWDIEDDDEPVNKA